MIGVHAGLGRVSATDAAARETFATIEDVARQTVADIDELVGALRGREEGGVEPPPGLAALDTLLERHRRAGLDVQTTIEGEPRALRPGVDRGAYRILQEALTNSARHGRGAARVGIAFGTAALELTVENPVDPGRARREGHGLIGMRERAASLGGSFETIDRDGRFSLHARLPAMTRVLIVEDDALMRAGLRGILEREAALEVVGEAQDGREALAHARRTRPDVVLMDIRMPGMDGISATREVLAALPETRVMILTTFEQDDYIFGALRAGASGFLLKRTRPEELVAAIHTVAAGDSLLSPSVTSRVIARMAQRPAVGAEGGAERLTTREREVLRLVARGLSNAEIAAELVIEESTVKTHTKRLVSKLGLRDRVQVVIYAYEHGLAGQ